MTYCNERQVYAIGSQAHVSLIDTRLPQEVTSIESKEGSSGKTFFFFQIYPKPKDSFSSVTYFCLFLKDFRNNSLELLIYHTIIDMMKIHFFDSMGVTF